MYHIDARKLQAKIVEREMTQEALAAELGIDRSTLRRRINSAKLQVRDIHKICDVLQLTNLEAIEIFLAE